MTTSSPLQVGSTLVIPRIPFTDIGRDGGSGEGAALPSAGPVPNRLRQTISETAPNGWAEEPGSPEFIVLRSGEDDIRFEVVEPPEFDAPAWIARDINDGAIQYELSDGSLASVRSNVQTGGWRMHVALPGNDYLLQATPVAPDPDFDYYRLEELAEWVTRIRAEFT